MKNGQIDTLFETNEHTENEQITKKIQKGIRNNIYKRAVMVVLAALILIAGGFYVGDRIKEAASFHLSAWESVVSDDLITETAEMYHMPDPAAAKDILNAQAYISAYCSVFLPGIIPEFSEPDQRAADASPYGTYRIGGKLLSYFEVNPENEPVRIHAEDNDSFIEIRDGRIVADQTASILNAGSTVLKNLNTYEPYSGLEEGDFYSHFRKENTDYKTLAYQLEIESLPKSAMISMDIRFAEPTTVYNLLKAAAGYQNSRIVYAVTDYLPKEGDYDECAIGFSLIGGNGPSSFLEGYASLNMDDTLRRDKSYFQQGMFYYNNRASFAGEPKDGALRMEEMYRTQLELLINNHLLNEREERAARTALQNMDADGVTVIGYRIFASKEDAITILKKSSTLRSHIVSVRYSRFS
ncbi:MAG: hypothetical protein IJ201_04905 [Solobacterium sp.]|nr:hypothetical protein [Solobacterium sp.]